MNCTLKKRACRILDPSPEVSWMLCNLNLQRMDMSMHAIPMTHAPTRSRQAPKQQRWRAILFEKLACEGGAETTEKKLLDGVRAETSESFESSMRWRGSRVGFWRDEERRTWVIGWIGGGWNGCENTSSCQMPYVNLTPMSNSLEREERGWSASTGGKDSWFRKDRNRADWRTIITWTS